MAPSKRIIVFLMIACCLLAVSQSKTKIRTIDQTNFQQFSKDNSYWIIQISQSKCPQCQQHQQQLIDTAELLQGVCKIGKVDAKLLQGLKIKKNPTYMFLRSDNLQQNVELKDQKISKVTLAKFCMEQIQKAIKKRHKTLFGTDQKSGDKSKQKTNNQQQPQGQKKVDYSKVVELKDSNFEKAVLESKQAWFVQFYSPSCGHCKNLQPQYNKLPGKMGQKVRIAKIDATVHRQTASKYQIKGFPTMMLFDIEDKQKPIPYQGQRTAQDISQWLNSQKLSKVKKQFHQLTQKNYKWYCNKNIVCNIFILDDISQKSKLKFIKNILQEDIDKPIQYFYSLRLPTFESLLMIQDRSCPKMVSTWEGINSYRVYNEQLSDQGLRKYITGLMERRKWIKFQQPSSSLLFEQQNTQL